MTSPPNELEDRIRVGLLRVADRAPTPDGLVGRVRAEVASPRPQPSRWRARATIGLAAAAVGGLVVASAVLLGDDDSSEEPVGDPVVVPGNPSISPDFALCGTLVDEVGDAKGGTLVRAVTVPTARLERWLPVALSTYERLDPAAPTTTICVFETTPQPAPGPPGADSDDSDGVQVLAQSPDAWDVRSIGPVQSLFADLDPLQREIREKLDEKRTRGSLMPRNPGAPCRYAEPATLPRSLADEDLVRVPNTTVANPDNLVSVWTCGTVPALRYPGADVYFEDGHLVRSRAELERYVAASMKQFEGSSAYVATALFRPVEVHQPVDGTRGEVLYVDDAGRLMRVLGDGSIPSDQLLEVVTSSTSLGDRELP